MTFKDYYNILEIPIDASPADIKSAYKRQALKWHPDKNIGIDTTKKMQDINEAYLILSDPLKRKRYNTEFEKFYKGKSNQQSAHQSTHNKTREKTSSTVNDSEDYEFEDITLRDWINQARAEAAKYVNETIRDVGNLSKTASKAAGEKMLQLFLTYGFIGLVLMIIFQTCN